MNQCEVMAVDVRRADCPKVTNCLSQVLVNSIAATGANKVRARQYWKPTEKEELARHYCNGVPVRDLAACFSRSEANIRAVLRSVGACLRQQRLTPKQKERIELFVAQGLTDIEIARELKCSQSTVKRTRRQLGIRKYRRTDMTANGWPIGSQGFALQLLQLLEKHRLRTQQELLVINGDSIPRMIETLDYLIEQKLVCWLQRSRDVVYDLADRVKTMRREYRRQSASPQNGY